jgi:hypothetical protein
VDLEDWNNQGWCCVEDQSREEVEAEGKRNRSPLVKDLSTLSTLGGVPSNSAATDILLEHRGKSIDKEKKCSRLERRREVGAPRSCS